MRQTECGKRIFPDGSPRRLFVSLSDLENTQTSDARQCEPAVQGSTNLKHVYNDRVNTDISYDEFCVATVGDKNMDF